MIKVKKKGKNNMKKLMFTLCLSIILFNTSVSFAETKKDCSQYSKDTIVGTFDKWRCEQGKGERKKLELGKKLKNLFKKN